MSYSINLSNITLLILLSMLNSTEINSIYIYKKENFLDFLPEVGRANRDRDNKDSYSYLFIKSNSYKLINENPPNFEINIESFYNIDKFYLSRYINEKICRRRIIKYYL